jgi:hypothetical protein
MKGSSELQIPSNEIVRFSMGSMMAIGRSAVVSVFVIRAVRVLVAQLLLGSSCIQDPNIILFGAICSSGLLQTLA